MSMGSVPVAARGREISRESGPAVFEPPPVARPGGQLQKVTTPMRKLPVWKKCIFGLVTAVGFLGVCEGLLRLAGYEGTVSDPFESFVRHVPLFEPDGDEMRTRPGRDVFFHPQRFLRKKPGDLIRLAAFGGSATYGWMLEDPLLGSYPNRLADEVAGRRPEIRAEAINCGGITYASYRLVGR